MASYNVVTYCRICRKRFVLSKEAAKSNYCADCQKKAGWKPHK